MSEPKQETIVLDILRVASTEVLGQTKPLSVATPFCFSNAQGNLKEVDSYEQIQRIAAESAANFRAKVLVGH